MEFVCFVVGAFCGTLLRQERQLGNNVIVVVKNSLGGVQSKRSKARYIQTS